MKNNFELFHYLQYKKSWGRNQILKIDFKDRSILHKISSSMEKPNENIGTIYKILANIVFENESKILNNIDDCFHSFADNISKDMVIQICTESNLNTIVLENLCLKLRFKNSKRHLREKLYFSYLNYKFEHQKP